MIRVRCQQHVTVDAKGRLALPAPIRRALEEGSVGSVVLGFYRGAVWAWTPQHYEQEVEARMMQQDPFSPDVLDFAHGIMASAQDAEIDAAGRVRIPPSLRELANIEKDVVVHVLLGHIEIWDKGAWDRRFAESLVRSRGQQGMPGRVGEGS